MTVGKLKKSPSVETVIVNMTKNVTNAKEIIRKALKLIPSQPNWPSQHVLDNAIMTQRSDWPSATIDKLKPIIGRLLKCSYVEHYRSPQQVL